MDIAGNPSVETFDPGKPGIISQKFESKNDQFLILSKQTIILHLDFVAKYMVKKLNKDSTNKRGEGGHRFIKLFQKITL